MTISTIPLIQARIKAATTKSPIAVFKLPVGPHGLLASVFGSTFRTQQSIRQGDPLFVGYFHNQMDVDVVWATLTIAARD